MKSSKLWRINTAQIKKAFNMLLVAVIIPKVYVIAKLYYVNNIFDFANFLTIGNLKLFIATTFIPSITYIAVTFLSDENGNLVIWKIFNFFKVPKENGDNNNNVQ